MRTRWIKIGAVKSGAILLLSTRGMAHGLWINWRGRQDWCQANEYADWGRLYIAVEHRLALAGLELVAAASRLPRVEYQELWVLIKRKRKAEKRESGNDYGDIGETGGV